MKKMPITNTSKQDPMEHLMMAMAVGGGGSIELSEANGQTELVHSEQLPTDNRDRATMEAWGIVFGDPCPDDPMFCPATLPDGWKKERTDHSMWPKVVDDKGRTRAMVFYKAAFYDRSAHMNASRRFAVRRDYDREDVVKFDATCDDIVLHSESRKFTGDKYGDDWNRAENECRDSCNGWLDAKYPDHADPVKSWDIEVSPPTTEP